VGGEGTLHPSQLEKNYVGIIRNRTLLCNSLIKPCRTPADIGGFTLLDVDTSGIPRDYRGFVRPGNCDKDGPEKVRVRSSMNAAANLRLRGPEVDLTKHIEPDWNGNPENVLLVIRYKGRRMGSVNPAITDLLFCLAYIPPIAEPQGQIVEEEVFECGMEDFLEGKILYSTRDQKPLIIQSFNSPCMQYATVGWLGRQSSNLASNCINTAVKSPRRGAGAIIAGS
jgi:hypothetical protein